MWHSNCIYTSQLRHWNSKILKRWFCSFLFTFTTQNGVFKFHQSHNTCIWFFWYLDKAKSSLCMVLLTTKARVFLLMHHTLLTTTISTTHMAVFVVTSTMSVRSAVANSVCQGLKLGSVLVLVSLRECWSFCF